MHLCFEGKVVSGKQLGRTIGFPTANIAYLSAEGKAGFPEDGVYIASVVIRGEVERGVYPAIVNQGKHPTAPDGPPTIEAHLLGWPVEESLYGKDLTLTYLHFLRPEQKFPSLDALRTQLTKDRDQALLYAQTRPELFCK